MKKHYGTLDGLRMIAAFGIVMMHIQANTDYQLSGFIYDRVIPSFTNFTFLFMVISAFGMCCGYYEKVLTNQIDWETFYLKRFKKIFPFFWAELSHCVRYIVDGNPTRQKEGMCNEKTASDDVPPDAFACPPDCPAGTGGFARRLHGQSACGGHGAHQR